jgi:hypothetical protein
MISLFLPEGKIEKYRRLPPLINTGGRVLHFVYESSAANNNRIHLDGKKRRSFLALLVAAGDARRYASRDSKLHTSRKIFIAVFTRRLNRDNKNCYMLL